MVKKRQADLDSSSLSIKPQKTFTTLRDTNKVTKKKNTTPRGFTQFVSAARDLLFRGGKKADAVKSKHKAIPSDQLHGIGAVGCQAKSPKTLLPSATKSTPQPGISEVFQQNSSGKRSKRQPCELATTPSRRTRSSSHSPGGTPKWLTTPLESAGITGSGRGKKRRKRSNKMSSACTPEETDVISAVPIASAYSVCIESQSLTPKPNKQKVSRARGRRSISSVEGVTETSVCITTEETDVISAVPIASVDGASIEPLTPEPKKQKVSRRRSQRSILSVTETSIVDTAQPLISNTTQSSISGTTPAPRCTPIQTVLQGLATHMPRGYSGGETSSSKPDAVVDRTQQVWQDGGTEDSWIVAFSELIELRGLATVISLTTSGCVEIHGHTLKYGEHVKVYSPPGYHNGVVEHHVSEDISGTIGFPALQDIKTALPDLELALYAKIKAFCTEHPDCALIHITELEEPQLLPCLEFLPTYKVSPGYKKLGQRLALSDCNVAVRYSSNTLSAVEHLIRHQQSGEPLRVVVCGAKDLGKSTLVRFMINKLLSQCSEGVTHLECDPSQCEFSPPGCLTLHTVNEPLLGPPWCHVPAHVDHMELYGAISADVDPDKYMSCVRRLAQEYGTMDTPTPLIVSTMGWKQGLGLQLLSATVAAVKPTHLIQLCTDNQSYKNFPELSVLSVASHDTFIPEVEVGKLHRDLRYELMPLTMTHYEHLEYETDVLRPVRSRDLMTTSYMFKSCLPGQRVVNEMMPYCVAMSDVALVLAYETLPPRLVSDAVNMHVVVLCQAPDEALLSSEDSHFLSLAESAELTVHGYGLVRAIDPNRKCVYVTTPLSPDRLSAVNVLYKIHGTITPDMWLFHQIGKVKDDRGLPYVGTRKSGAGFVATGQTKYKYRKGRT